MKESDVSLRFWLWESFNAGKFALAIKQYPERTANTVTEVKTGEYTGRETDGTPVPGRGVNIRGNALIEFDPLIRADAEIHDDLLHEP